MKSFLTYLTETRIDTPQGFMDFEIIPKDTFNSELNIKTTYTYIHLEILKIKQEYQSKGFGTILLNNLKNKAKEMDLPIILDPLTYRSREYFIKNGFDNFDDKLLIWKVTN